LPIEAALYIDHDGATHHGAGAVFALLRETSPITKWLYEKIPPFRFAADLVYGFISRHRTPVSWLDRVFMGNDPRIGEYGHTVGWFLRGLGAVYAMAFVSLLPQITGLVGEHGILPAAQQLASMQNALGTASYWEAPSVFWLNATDSMLRAVCFWGAAAGTLLALGFFPGVMLLICWLLYLSVCGAGSIFLGFQWDALLLEAGFLALLLVPWRSRLPHGGSWTPATLPRWLLMFLVFRLMFGSGIVKLLSNDPVWWNLTALEYHYWTQPLPNPLSWWAHQLPSWLHRACCCAMFFIELVAPFGLFAPRRVRIGAGILLAVLQVIIFATGNYAFFNALSLVLCILLVDDAFILRRRPQSASDSAPANRATPGLRGWPCWIRCIGGMYLLVAATASFLPSIGVRFPADRLAYQLAVWISPLRSVNTYGLFANMTTERPEIVLESSADAIDWTEIRFRWKPGDLARAPAQVAPHQPRLDWQMWFAALGAPEQNVWVFQLMKNLTNGNRETGALFESFDHTNPPRHVRALLYRYRFTTPAEKRGAGNWWARELVGQYGPTIDRAGFTE
jgi:hypothetical protein